MSKRVFNGRGIEKLLHLYCIRDGGSAAEVMGVRGLEAKARNFRPLGDFSLCFEKIAILTSF